MMRLKPTRKGSAKVLRNLVLLAAVFWLGLSIGNGSIDFSKSHSPNSGLPARLNYGSLDKLYQSLRNNYDGKLTEQQLIDGLKHGLAQSAHDPYTVYFTPKEARDFNNALNNSFSGIGAQLGQDKDGNLEVIAPIDGLPADKAGLKAKDLVAAINGQSTSGLTVDEAVSKIRGPAGSKVKLQIVRNRSQTLEFTITRQDIKLPSVKSKILKGNVGYIQISTFADDTIELTQKAARQFKQKGVKAVILDLRNDPGGLLDAAVRVASLWLEPGQKILDERRGNQVVDSSQAVGGDVLRGLPTVVLINDGSASASEIVAGALHDNKAAYLIGEKTYGKGVVQQLINFKDGSQLKVTVASWYRPNGQNINHLGIKPDKTVKISDEDAKTGTDTQLQAAQAYLSR
jgi:carboxyl-terminal processing protease